MRQKIRTLSAGWVYKASRQSKQDQVSESTVWNRGSVTFAKDDCNEQNDLFTDITVTGPMIIPVGEVPSGTIDELELNEEDLIRFAKKFVAWR